MTDRTWTEDGWVRWPGAPLDPDDVRALTTTCRELGLSDDQVFAAEFSASLLKWFHRQGRKKLITPGQRAKALERVERAAGELLDAMRSLDDVEAVAVSALLPTDPENRALFQLPHPNGLSLRDQVLASHLSRLEAIGDAAYTWRMKLPGVGKRGPMNKISVIAQYVEELWLNIQPTDLAPTQGGAFERLCQAVFDAAKAGDANHAVRYFVKHGARDQKTFFDRRMALEANTPPPPAKGQKLTPKV